MDAALFAEAPIGLTLPQKPARTLEARRMSDAADQDRDRRSRSRIVTVSRPEKLNAFDIAMLQALAAACDAIEADAQRARR